MNVIKSIKTILIDDEAEARDVLSTLLALHHEVDLVATADNADAGLDLIVKYQPDLVFLDIRMPRKTGFDLVSELRGPSLNPVIVFVTAYDEYAIQAFKVAAFDYLLKPVDRKKRICELRKDGVVVSLDVSRNFIRELE